LKYYGILTVVIDVLGFHLHFNWPFADVLQMAGHYAYLMLLSSKNTINKDHPALPESDFQAFP